MIHYHRIYSMISVMLQGKSSDTLLEKILPHKVSCCKERVVPIRYESCRKETVEMDYTKRYSYDKRHMLQENSSERLSYNILYYKCHATRK